MKRVSIGELVKYTGKTLLGKAFSTYKEGLGKPIILLSTRRSGSTLLMRMIYSQPGVSFIDQPLDLWRYHPYRKRLAGLHSLSRFINLDPAGEEILKEFFARILRGEIRLHSQWNPFDPDFSFRIERLVIKVLNAKTLADWFVSKFNAELVYLVRHPIPVALSILKRSWGCTAEAFLDNKEFCEKFLSEEQVTKAWDILKSGSPLERYIVEWCLENIYPLRVFHERPWLTLTYEELVLRPQEISKLICDTLALPNPERMAERVLMPTKTAVGDSRKEIKSRGSSHLITRWVAGLDKDEVMRIAEIIDMFCPTTVYEAHDPYPVDDVCHFGSLRRSFK